MMCTSCGHDPNLEKLYNCQCQCHDTYQWLKPALPKAEKIYSLEDIRMLCLKHDKSEGKYPENEYEGKSVYHFISKEKPVGWEDEIDNA